MLLRPCQLKFIKSDLVNYSDETFSRRNYYRENYTTYGKTTSTVGENGKTTDGENNGGNQIYIIVIVVLAIVVVAGVASILIKTIKDWRIKQNTETEEFNENSDTEQYNETKEFNENYGNLDAVQYYEEEKKCKIVDSNDYY